MTLRIPLHRCRKCLHYRRETCQLPDLDPCDFSPINGKIRPRCWARAEMYIIAALAIIAVAAIFFACHKPESNPTESDGITIDAVSAVELLREQHRGELSDMDKLVLAIGFVESRWNPDAVGSNNDLGFLQITPIFCAEASRVSGANFRHEDALSIDSSLAMFAAIQGRYNGQGSIEQAIYHHNKSGAYRAKVLKAYELVERYETIRAKLIETHY